MQLSFICYCFHARQECTVDAFKMEQARNQALLRYTINPAVILKKKMRETEEKTRGEGEKE